MDVLRQDLHMMALVTNIQRYAIHDGGGIRTTVFLRAARWLALGVITRRPKALTTIILVSAR